MHFPAECLEAEIVQLGRVVMSGSHMLYVKMAIVESKQAALTAIGESLVYSVMCSSIQEIFLQIISHNEH